jgi:hypothetical protein
MASFDFGGNSPTAGTDVEYAGVLDHNAVCPGIIDVDGVDGSAGVVGAERVA